MSENLANRYKSKMIALHDHPFVYATLTDFQPGKGLLQIHSDWGMYSAFWGSMGKSTLAQFLLSCNSSYIEKNFHYQMNYLGVKKEGFGRLTKFMAHCWPRIKEELLLDENISEKTIVS